MQDDVDAIPTSPQNPSSRRSQRTSTDQWDRRFRIEGDAIEALKVVIADQSEKDS